MLEKDDNTTLKHVVITDGFISEEDLLMLRECMFQFNVRGHGDYEDQFVWMQGTFWQRDGKIVFRSRDPLGNYKVYESDDDYDLRLRVHAYLKFID